MQKTIILTAILLLMPLMAMRAQNRTFMLMEQNPEYGQQYWFSSGVGNELDCDKIKQHWNNDRYITAVAYTENGWSVAMSKDSKFSNQSYKYSGDFPRDWIKEKWDAGYYITAITCNQSKWFVVMSKYQGYTDQSYKHATLSELNTWYDQKRSAGYFLTQATYSSGKWWWVVTRGTNIETQGYTWATDGDVGSEVKKIWNKGYRLHLVEYGGGQYLLAYGKLKGRTPQQSYNIDCNGVTAWLSKNWDNGMKLHYIGGGNPESQANNVASNQSNNGYSTTYQPGNNSWREELPGGGFRQNTRQADGSIISITSTPCLWCHGTKVCGICHGLGGTYGRAYGGMWYPCKSCAGSKVCQNCHGQGYSTFTSTVYPDGSGVGYDQNGRVTVTDGRGGGSGGSRSSSRDNGRSSNRRSGTCPKCGGTGYDPVAHQYAAGSSMAPYHNSGGTTCYICSRATDHYHYRCLECKRH